MNPLPQLSRRGFLAAASLAGACAADGAAQTTTSQPVTPGGETEATRLLKARSAEVHEEVIEVSKGVYVAVGYSASNVGLVVGTDGVIVIDTAMDPPAAKRILEQFRKLTDKPVKAVLLTHSHGDHTGGLQVFTEKDHPDVWGRSNFGSEDRPLKAAGLTIQHVRGVRQGGFRLPDDQRINNGIAPAVKPAGGEAFAPGLVPPTKTFSEERKRLEIAGVKLELAAAPGETDDQLYVWLPGARVLFCGDTFYKSFPNLYAIRGTPYRDVRTWAASLDKLLKEGAEHLVAGHTRPISGAKEVRLVLTDYRDAVRFVHDKTVEGMNQGMTPDQAVEYVKMPAKLASKDYLREYYGNVPWAVRSIFSGYLGWFDGNPTNLFRLTPKEEASRLAELTGGKDALAARAKNALAKADNQWAAQLADYLLALDPDDAEAKRVKSGALTALGVRCLTAKGRNYYLTVAAEILESIARKR
ncbi:MAG: alkyl sulfatase dimerization domain-containing protein [Planctomycetota bacterium]